MMAFGHAHRPVAAWPRAPAVANLERFALRSGDGALGPPDIDHRRVRAEDDARHRAVARDSLHRLGRDRQRELHVRPRCAGKAEQSLYGSRHLKVCPLWYETVVE